MCVHRVNYIQLSIIGGGRGGRGRGGRGPVCDVDGAVAGCEEEACW